MRATMLRAILEFASGECYWACLWGLLAATVEDVRDALGTLVTGNNSDARARQYVLRVKSPAQLRPGAPVTPHLVPGAVKGMSDNEAAEREEYRHAQIAIAEDRDNGLGKSLKQVRNMAPSAAWNRTTPIAAMPRSASNGWI